MNYSTLKKTVVLSIASLMGVVAAHAQTSSDSTTTVVPGSAKVFGGRAQYRTWSIGVNAGVLSPQIPFGSNDFTKNNSDLGYGLSIRKQLGHAFGLQLDGTRGVLSGDNSRNISGAANGSRGGYTSFRTDLAYSATLSGVVNVATVDFIRRKNAVNFFVDAGAGLAGYAPKVTLSNGRVIDYKNNANDGHTYVHELVIPVGVGVKFRLSDGIALNLGYKATFVDGDNLDGASVNYPTKDKFSYGYGGLEFTLGNKAKPNLDWVNPVAMMYDELKDPTLRQEVEALKGRVSNVESAVNDLKKDSDGDGVSDQFDKCPGTPAGTIVDGSGCEIKFPKPDTTVASTPGNYTNIQFEFDSSVLRTSAYPTLDKVSADLRSNATMTIELDGYASSEGSAAHNMRLSKDRANSVKTYLVNSGVDAKRLKIKAYGETNPIADNSTEQGRVLNRRVEFKSGM
ncbi:OmpA family protein [Mucilaginibacter arboris]|uniref:OmpA family protein n=1 Tax=Mucilaginibacter arboris TaxID=2682090 RepID=A0A7K1SVB4_9SPHI|nr:OmpA family protein [Mucilaginibacter arboris]MVN21282.1 OmpA family protein [Mucilaginibacter arboris]